MDNRVIDGVVRLVEGGNKLPTSPSWLALRDEIAGSQIFSIEKLEQSKEYIIEKFYQFRIERLQQDMAQLLGRPTPPKDSTNPSQDMASSQGSNKDSGFNGSCKLSESGNEGGFEPTVIETINEERFTFMSVGLNGTWEGAALEYCREDESFISPHWVQRHNLELTDGQILLTWKFDSDDKTHYTRFILLENLKSDFILGVKCCDESFNRDNRVPRSPGASHSFRDLSALPLENTKTQVWVTHNQPNIEFLSDVLYRLEKKYRADTLDPNYSYLSPQHGGVIEEDCQSRSNTSSVPNRGHRPGQKSSSSRSHK